MQGLLRQEVQNIAGLNCPLWRGELWTARQRQMHRLHYAVSYRASFKPELPDFFIRHFLLGKNKKGALVLDPFGGRGTTILQANLLGLSGIHNDLNPVSLFLARSRQSIPKLEDLIRRTEGLPLEKIERIERMNRSAKIDRRSRAKGSRKSRRNTAIPLKDRRRLLPFFEERTLHEIFNLRSLLLAAKLYEDKELAYIALTALSRLHGHSEGFLSVYSFPQISIMPAAQTRNNLKLGRKPEYRPVKPRIIRKLKTDLAMPLPAAFTEAASKNRYLQEDARKLRSIASNSVDLIVSSPPFLNKVDYQKDNWMRAWFLDLEESIEQNPPTMIADLQGWCDFMEAVMREMGRVLKPQAHAVIEVGDISIGSRNYNLEEAMATRLPLRVIGGLLEVKELFINQQQFTKLSHCWSVANNKKGTNSNRCLVLQKN